MSAFKTITAKYLCKGQGKVWNGPYEVKTKILELEYHEVDIEKILQMLGLKNDRYSSADLISIQFLTLNY